MEFGVNLSFFRYFQLEVGMLYRELYIHVYFVECHAYSVCLLTGVCEYGDVFYVPNEEDA